MSSRNYMSSSLVPTLKSNPLTACLHMGGIYGGRKDGNALLYRTLGMLIISIPLYVCVQLIHQCPFDHGTGTRSAH